ncbi:enoyl-CoA hydratase/isomerase family protein [Priestia abyssalis]|uniref:enoyl-CoA hydratase/isomerase family protein n=1 Tax=Priestia abyssalis TaxID=1221450 RepID=UPI0009950697|nr:enoyl-CoA hydratase/isomerase family protein [Priestia abyssalis]
MESNVISYVDRGAGWLKLNRPQALNALNAEMVEKMYETLDAWRTDPSVAFVCISGEGTKGLCAGGDMRFFYDHRNSNVEECARRFFTTEYQVDLMIHEYPKPIVVYMDGIVMGGGVGLSVGASERIVTERTKWAMPEMSIGFFPDVGASYFLNQMPGHVGRYLALTGETILTADVLYVGAANRYMESNRWEEFIQEIQKTNWNLDKASKQMGDILDAFCSTLEDESPISLLQSKIDKHFAYETVEEIVASLGKAAESGDDWAAKTRSTIQSKSPTSLKVTLRQLQKGKNQSLLSCFNMELALSMNFMKNYSFYEGVRAVLVDKDRKPNWKPNSLADVREEEVERFFYY